MSSGTLIHDPGLGLDEAEIATRLARRIAAGDAAAEAELVERYSQDVHFLLQHRAGPDLADDLHQETFRIALARLRERGLDDPAGLSRYLRGIARKLAKAEWSKIGRRRNEPYEEALAEAVHPGPSPQSTVLLDEEAETVRQLIGELSTDRDRQVLWRFYVLEEEKEHICTDLDLNSLHFNRVLFRAHQRFKKLFERYLSH